MAEEDLEAVGEQLYTRIYLKHKDAAGKLTGMLLELPAPVLSRMLQDDTMLSDAVEKALRALQVAQDPSYRETYEDEDDASVSSDSLGEQLFELVDVYHTGHSQKITGMLLEQHREAILNLLSDRKLLEEKVHLALETIREADAGDASDADDTEKLGEELFCLVEEIDPLHANDITGMLLEMDPTALQQLLGDHATLEVAVRKAQAALDTGH